MKYLILAFSLIACSLAFAQTPSSTPIPKVIQTPVVKNDGQKREKKELTNEEMFKVAIKSFLEQVDLIKNKTTSLKVAQLKNLWEVYVDWLIEQELADKNFRAIYINTLDKYAALEGDKLIKELESFVKSEILKKTSKMCVKEKESCLINSCCSGLSCLNAPAVIPQGKNTCKAIHSECSTSADCCSQKCDKLSKKCIANSICIAKVSLGSSCTKGEVCEKGTCQNYDKDTSGIGTCTRTFDKCSSSDQCCSGNCLENKCMPRMICSDCVGEGKSISGTQECCVGLYPNLKGVCIPDLPPLVPEVY